MKKKVYVAGPLTRGDVAMNVRNALLTADLLIRRGFAPYVPHLTFFWDLVFARPYAEWLELDLEYLRCCDAVLRLPGESKGVEWEVSRAVVWGIPVFESVEDLLRHYGEAREGKARRQGEAQCP